jgi:hypothetical protein
MFTGYGLLITDLVENFHSAPVKSFNLLFGATVFTCGSALASLASAAVFLVDFVGFDESEGFSLSSLSQKSDSRGRDPLSIAFATSTNFHLL